MKPSELILNPDGSVYHLHLQPEQVAPLIITVGDQDRVPRVSRYFDLIEFKVRKREFVTHTGWLGKTRLSVVSTGIGPDNVDIVLNELDALFNIDLGTRQIKPDLTQLTFIRLGTAGSLQREVPLDSFVASSGAIGMDGLLQYYDAPEQQKHPLLDALNKHCKGHWDFPLAPYYVEGDPGLLDVFTHNFHHGITSTNPGFYGPQGRQLRARVRQPRYLDLLQTFEFQGNKIINLEMETAAIYGLSQLLGHRAMSLSTILANRAEGKFSQNPARSVRLLLETALEKI
ncbi:MAG: nucleoside phosphorylase, partial [Saprospiraceae bacterium]|nr:nucleoside phosphorylase [Saprospiraceae bacterium]